MAKNYSKYEYETSPKKLAPSYAPNEKKKNIRLQNEKKAKKQKETNKLKVKIMMYAAIVFTILFAISYRNAQIDENFEEVQKLKAELASIEKENAQLEVSIESNLNLTNLEQQARNLLGMQKLTNKQTVYVTLPKMDYIETAAEQVVIEEKDGVLETIGKYIKQLFK